MARKRSQVYGVGINDADYKIVETALIDGKCTIIWSCPFYFRWKDMLRRCYSEQFLCKYPTYDGCSTVPEWHYFMNFRGWMEKQDWQGKHLDKDLLFPGNRVYSPDTCLFVDQQLNKFVTDSKGKRGIWPIGVNKEPNKSKFRSTCNDGRGNIVHLGYFDTPEEAHAAWLVFKVKQAEILASQQTDERLAKALVERYKNYQPS